MKSLKVVERRPGEPKQVTE